MGTREVPAPGGLGPRSQPVADATRVYGYPAARNGLALQDREETGTREGPAPWGPGPKPAGGRRHPHVRLDCSPTRARATGPGKGGDPRGSCPRGPRSEKPAGGRRHPHVRPQHSSASGQASFGTTPPPCSPKRARATDRGEAGIAEAPAPRGGGRRAARPHPSSQPPLWALVAAPAVGTGRPHACQKDSKAPPTPAARPLGVVGRRAGGGPASKTGPVSIGLCLRVSQLQSQPSA